METHLIWRREMLMKCLSTILNMIIIWHSIWRSILFCVSFSIDFFFVLFEERFVFIGNCSLRFRLCQKIYFSKPVIFCLIKSAYFANLFLLAMFSSCLFDDSFANMRLWEGFLMFFPVKVVTVCFDFRVFQHCTESSDPMCMTESIVSWCIENACILSESSLDFPQLCVIWSWFVDTINCVLFQELNWEQQCLWRTSDAIHVKLAQWMTPNAERCFFHVLCWHFSCQAVNDTCNCITLIHIYLFF